MNALKKVVSKHSRRSSASSDREERSSPLTPASPRWQDTVPRLPSEGEGPSRQSNGARTSMEGAQRGMEGMSLGEGTREGAESTLPLPSQQEHEGSRGLGSTLSSAILEHKDTVQDHQTLAPVVHHRIHHHETELVTRHKEVERHIHHVQHHVQPLIEEVHNEEKHYHQTHPMTEIYEEHPSTAADKEFFALLNKQKFTETHICEERIVIDNGEKVRQTVHYHVHNIIQPVIYRDRPIPASCVPASAALSSASHPLSNPASAQTQGQTSPGKQFAKASPRAGAATLTGAGGKGHGVPLGQGQTGLAR